MLVITLITVAAFIAGITGTWSPCGLSMVETIGGPHSGRGRWVVAMSCATFTMGAVIGGLVTFVLLASLGGVLSSEGGVVALAVAALIAALAAAAEFAELRIIPQIPRQVPESWRRMMPLPVAGVLYGALLGLGFTTFVLTMAVWALAAIAVALGSLAIGAAIGIRFGLGRALPIAVLAPRADQLGHRVLTMMAERPRLLRTARACNGVMLTLLAGTFALSAGTGQALGHAAPGTPPTSRTTSPPTTTPATGQVVAATGFGPSLSGHWRAWGLPRGQVAISGPDGVVQLPGHAVAVGGGLRAILVRGTVEVWPLGIADWDQGPGAPLVTTDVDVADDLAINGNWLAWRRPRPGGGEFIYAASLPGLQTATLVASIGAEGQLSRPNLHNDTVVFAQGSGGGSRIVSVNLANGTRTELRRSRILQFRDPALRAGRLLYVEADHCAQRLMIGPARPGARGRSLLSIGSTARRDRGHDPARTRQGAEASSCPPGSPRRTDQLLGATALSSSEALVDIWRPGPVLAASRIVRVPLR